MLTVRARRLVLLLAALTALLLAGCGSIAPTPAIHGLGAQNRVGAFIPADQLLAQPTTPEIPCSRPGSTASGVQVAAGFCVATEEGLSAATNSVDVLANPSDVEGLTPQQVDDLAQNAGYEVKPGKASAANPATRYYLPGTNNSEGFRVLPEGVAGQGGVKGGAYLRYFGGPNNGIRVPLS